MRIPNLFLLRSVKVFSPSVDEQSSTAVEDKCYHIAVGLSIGAVLKILQTKKKVGKIPTSFKTKNEKNKVNSIINY